MLVDSHAHLDSYEDLSEVLDRARAAGVTTILAIGIGDGPADMHRALEIAKMPRSSGPQVFASVGIHPQEAHQASPESLEKLRELAEDPLCLAIGEIGLDYYHAGNPEIEVQKSAFAAQMQIASDLGKPILIHCRTSDLARPDAKARFGAADAWEDLLDLIAEHWAPHAIGGIMHCFSGNADQAQRSIEAGFHLSFAGNVTYPKALSIREVAASAPADRILVETDAPFLAPIPHRGERNEPALVVHTAAEIADLRGISTEDLASLTTANFLHLFPAATRLA